jgi:hypothetical protein
MRKELLRVIVQKLGEMGKEVNDTLYPLVSEAEKEFNQVRFCISKALNEKLS